LNPNNPISRTSFEATDLAAKTLNIKLEQYEARGPSEFEIAFMTMAKRPIDAVVVLEDAMLIANAGTIGKLALKHGLPAVGFKEILEGGGLLSYGVDFPDMFRQSARLIDKIFKGSKPSDIPVEQTTKFEFVIFMMDLGARRAALARVRSLRRSISLPIHLSGSRTAILLGSPRLA
jgi:putative tryptophan/tyrosine transport system substrate-binding protein